MNNKKIGNKYEQEFLRLLAIKNYWAHKFQDSIGGQPVDILAIKDNKCWLLDVKHCSVKRFSFNDIQPNQITCMELAREKGITRTGFVIYFELEKKFMFLPYNYFKMYVAQEKKSVLPTECLELDVCL